MKFAGLGLRQRVFVDDARLTVGRNEREFSIPIKRIARIHLLQVLIPPATFLLHSEIIDEKGRGVSFLLASLWTYSKAKRLPEASLTDIRKLLEN